LGFHRLALGLDVKSLIQWYSQGSPRTLIGYTKLQTCHQEIKLNKKKSRESIIHSQISHPESLLRVDVGGTKTLTFYLDPCKKYLRITSSYSIDKINLYGW